MIAVISPSVIRGNITASASKSAMQRACALALLHTGETYIYNPGKSNDDKAALEIISGMGAIVEYPAENTVLVKSNGEITVNGEINCGESGLSFRMFAPIAALSGNEIILNGSGSLLNRPMDFLDQVFPQLGIEITSNYGKLPLKIRGPLHPKTIKIDASQSSQYLTGLLFAYAKSATAMVSINVDNLKSKPYIDLSLEMLRHFGYDVLNKDYQQFFIKPVKTQKETIEYFTEGDWSGAAFLLVAGAVSGDIIMRGLNLESSQADIAILKVLKVCGADISIDGMISINNKNKLKRFTFDATDCPDLFPPLVALAANCVGISCISGVSRLREKESDRGIALVDIFSRMGISIEIQADEMFITGGQITGTSISSHHDHRIAMAGAVAGLQANDVVTISDAEAVNKSYPAFYDHLKALGAEVSLKGV
ncbi:MAG TPA: 3-phosphoshikimate 1-carboxyvinyltransferase [Ferruginibacter sp.]|nr:3-phosphoshikimate 1-carboxyvinyltransferase [Ferruginibacter sp.]